MKNKKPYYSLNASSAKRWLSCPGSVKLVSTVPRPESTAFAVEGIWAHEIAERCLKTGANATDFIGEISEEHKVTFTKEDAPNVQSYVDYVREKSEGKSLKIEHKFALKPIHKNMKGYVDAVIYEPFGDFEIVDFKYGAGLAVEVENNYQLLYYALGCFQDLKLYEYDIDRIFITISQPRVEHKDGTIRSVEVSIDDLKKFKEKLVKGVKIALGKDPQLFDGDHCQFCPAAGVCPKLHEKTKEVTRTDFASDLPNVQKLTPEQLGKVILHSSQITAFLKAAKEHAFQLVRNGQKVPGTKLVKNRSTRKWVDDSSIGQKLTELGLASDEIYNMKLNSPPTIEKIIGKEAYKNDLLHLVHKPDTGVTLVAETDRRKEFKQSSAKEDFGIISDDEEF